jgi:hypothetical protein
MDVEVPLLRYGVWDAKRRALNIAPIEEIRRNHSEWNIIYPTNRKKYRGHYRWEEGAWRVRCSHAKFVKRKNMSCKTESDAFELLKRINIEDGLPIKNIIVDCGMFLVTSLTQGQYMLFSREDLELVQRIVISAHCEGSYGKFTAMGRNVGDNSPRYIHHMITGYVLSGEKTVDHKNRYSLDNRRENLRIVSWLIQLINRDMLSTNTSGTIGVFEDVKNKCWCVSYIRSDATSTREDFYWSTWTYDGAKGKAVAYRKMIERTLPHYIEALYPDGLPEEAAQTPDEEMSLDLLDL